MSVVQNALLCGCGSPELFRGDACRVCVRRAALSRDHFAGLRELRLHQDGYQCQVCGEIDDLLVHHRKPGVNALRWLVTLCRPCHVRVHHIRRPAFALDGELLRLWLEVNRGPVQVRFSFRPERASEQFELFRTPAGVWAPAAASSIQL